MSNVLVDFCNLLCMFINDIVKNIFILHILFFIMSTDVLKFN